eukprot:scaffold168_cov124-Cylindrotheca_fusiformis.AAC.7
MASLNMEQYKDFVLKLKIKAVDGTLKLKIEGLWKKGTSQIRRVRLPRIADVAGNVSYAELVGLVVTFHFPDGSPDRFICTLTYFDEDEDTVTIASDAELVDAIEQFAEKKVLRISTEVRPKNSLPSDPVLAPSTMGPPEASANRTDRGTSTAPDATIKPQIRDATEQVVGLLAAAVTSVEKGLATPPSNSSPPRTPAANETPLGKGTFAGNKVATFVAATPTCAQTVGNAGPKQVTAFVHGRHTCDSCYKTPIVGNRYHAVNRPDYDLCENCFKTYSGKETQFIEYPSENRIERLTKSMPTPPNEDPAPAPTSSPAPQVDAAPAEEEENLPFIHGRHTCDACMTTPIIGKRFHATNLKNYDMCESCHDNYRGTEIQFEAVELPRDRAFQKRWNRRRQRLESMGGRNRGRRGNAKNGRRRGCSKGNGHGPQTSPGQSSPSEGVPARVIPIQVGTAVSERNDEFDGDLKEAIRRSLEDAMPTETADVGSSEDISPIVPSAPTEEELEAPEDTEEEGGKEPQEEGEKEPVVEEPQEEGKSEPVVEEPVNTTAEIEPSVDETVDEKRFLQSMEDTMSVNSEDMVAEGDNTDKKPAAVILEASVSSPGRKAAPPRDATGEVSPKSTTDDSFALDAVGNGDIAEAMGATLDIVAGVISEMLTEADSHNNPKPTEEKEEVKEDVAEQAQKDAAGALILTADEKFEDEGEDDWQVVNENGDADDGIANATQMLGSALFNSDMRSSGENVSALTNSDCFSAATSVPSSVPSVHLGTDASSVSPAQRNRWTSQLEKLRELGFNNEMQCVETLERLHAANMGCDEEDEISVTNVVNAILEQDE